MAPSSDSSLRMPLVPAIRFAIAVFLWSPVVQLVYQRPATMSAALLEYGQWLAGWDDRAMLHFLRFIFVLWEMRAYASRAQAAKNRDLAETCLLRSEIVLGACMVASEIYLYASTRWTLPMVPWFLLVSNSIVILAVVGFVSLSAVRDLQGAAFVARMVLLFPARQLLPWSSAKDVYRYVTGQHQLVENEAWLQRRKWTTQPSDGKVEKRLPSSDVQRNPSRDLALFRLQKPVLGIVMAVMFWTYLLIYSPSSLTSPPGIQRVGEAAKQIIYVPWLFAADCLALLVDQQGAVMTALEQSRGDSQSLMMALPVLQMIFLQDTGLMLDLSLMQFHLFLGNVLFLFRLHRSGASRQEWLLAGRLLLRVPEMLLLPWLQAMMLYNYFQGHYDLVPKVMLSDEQKAVLRTNYETETGKDTET